MPAWKVVSRLLAIASAVAMLGLAAQIPVTFSQYVDVSYGPSLEVPSAPDDYEQAFIDSPFAGDVTRSMSVTAEILPDRSAVITESIVQVFATDRRGIYRTIPTSDRLGEHAVRDLIVSTSDGTPNDVYVEDISGGLSVRIGEEETYISGPHSYRLTYRLENVVEIDGDTATVRLDAITDWEQDIRTLEYAVSGPAIPISGSCYTGAFGSDVACATVATTDTGGTFATPADGLAAGDGFTVEFVYPAGAFAAKAAITDRNQQWWPVYGAGGLMAAGLAFAFSTAEKRRRRDVANAIAGIDETFSGPMSVDLEGRRQSVASPFPPPSASSALAVSAVPPLEFVPPVNLDPACLLRMHDGLGADIRKMVASTLVDLAADGVVGLEKAGKDWVLRRIEQPPRNVKSYELTLLNAILGDADEARLSDRKDEISGALSMYFVQIDNHLAELGLMNADFPARIAYSHKWRVLPFVVWPIAFAFLGGFLGVFASALGVQKFMVPVIGALFALAIMVAEWMSSDPTQAHLTPRGRGASYRARGFARFMNDSEAIHARAAERMGVMREYMGYAVAFDAVTTWTEAMPEAMREEIPFLADPIALGMLWRTPVLTGSSRSAFAPSTSSGGGFSFSGGGFSGGGSGGGGGGSW